MDNTQIIPVGKRIDHVYVDEASEFRAFASRTDMRRIREAECAQEELRERNRKRQQALQERKRISRNCALLFLGMVATCCGICAALVCRVTSPIFATFPASLAFLALWAGVKCR